MPLELGVGDGAYWENDFTRICPTEQAQEMDLEDLFLLEDPDMPSTSNGYPVASGSIGTAPGTPRKGGLDRAAPFLRRAVRMPASDAGMTMDSSILQETLDNKPRTLEEELQAIELGFEAAQRPIASLKHPTKPGLTAVEAHEFLPDLDAWHNTFELLRYSDDPAEELGTIFQQEGANDRSRLPSAIAERLSHALLRPILLQGRPPQLSYYLLSEPEAAAAFRERKAELPTADTMGAYENLMLNGEPFDYRYVREYEIGNERELLGEYFVSLRRPAPQSKNAQCAPLQNDAAIRTDQNGDTHYATEAEQLATAHSASAFFVPAAKVVQIRKHRQQTAGAYQDGNEEEDYQFWHRISACLGSPLTLELLAERQARFEAVMGAQVEQPMQRRLTAPLACEAARESSEPGTGRGRDTEGTADRRIRNAFTFQACRGRQSHHETVKAPCRDFLGHTRTAVLLEVHDAMDSQRLTERELQAEIDSLHSLRRRSISSPVEGIDPDLPPSLTPSLSRNNPQSHQGYASGSNAPPELNHRQSAGHHTTLRQSPSQAQITEESTTTGAKDRFSRDSAHSTGTTSDASRYHSRDSSSQDSTASMSTSETSVETAGSALTERLDHEQPQRKPARTSPPRRRTIGPRDPLVSSGRATSAYQSSPGQDSHDDAFASTYGPSSSTGHTSSSGSPMTSNLSTPFSSPSPSQYDDLKASEFEQQLYWLPARLHPEIAPDEFRNFIKDQTNPENLARRSSGGRYGSHLEGSSSLSRQRSGPQAQSRRLSQSDGSSAPPTSANLARKRSMLSRQYLPSADDGVGDKPSEGRARSHSPPPPLPTSTSLEAADGLAPSAGSGISRVGGSLRRSRSGMDHLTIEDLQNLERMANQAQDATDSQNGATGLRRKLSLNPALMLEALSENQALQQQQQQQQQQIHQDEHADAPLVGPSQGTILRRGARTRHGKAPEDDPAVERPPQRFGPGRRTKGPRSAGVPGLPGAAASSESLPISSDRRGSAGSDEISEGGHEAFEPVSKQTSPQAPLPPVKEVASPSLVAQDIEPDMQDSSDRPPRDSPPRLIARPMEAAPPLPAAEVPRAPAVPEIPLPPISPVHEIAPPTVPERPTVSVPTTPVQTSKAKKSGWAKLGFTRKDSTGSTKSSQSKTVNDDSDRASIISTGSDSVGSILRRSKKEKRQSEPASLDNEKAERTEKEPSFFGSLFSSRKKRDTEGSQHENRNGLYSPAEIVPSPTASGMLNKSGKYTNFYRLPIHVERAIYRLSHIKLANPRRPLYEQVLISNLMFWYLGVINRPVQPIQPIQPAPVPLYAPEQEVDTPLPIDEEEVRPVETERQRTDSRATEPAEETRRSLRPAESLRPNSSSHSNRTLTKSKPAASKPVATDISYEAQAAAVTGRGLGLTDASDESGRPLIVSNRANVDSGFEVVRPSSARDEGSARDHQQKTKHRTEKDQKRTSYDPVDLISSYNNDQRRHSKHAALPPGLAPESNEAHRQTVKVAERPVRDASLKQRSENQRSFSLKPSGPRTVNQHQCIALVLAHMRREVQRFT
ncbi:uncharacterized protein L969DRAFT_78073 [Mixia osmundae IAM 14324]|nr:uncharacterized protein L969DRAFT_78073 [Mixia osmundae IAM 14324]KEI37744.1 hypothetical protein L969DRAFT_78073 [Mixia osmundae IAM 14324]